MKCKKHQEDESSSAGVCASCLRQRLSALVAAQIQAAQINHLNEREELSDASHHAHTHVPRSVSPYMSRQKLVPDRDNKDNYHSLQAHKFFCTPQIGPTGKIIVDDNSIPLKKKGIGKLWLFRNLFRSKSAIASIDLDPRVSESRETSSAPIPSRSWFSSVASKRKQLRTCSLDESKTNCQRTSNNHHHNRGRGMSPAICSDDEDHVTTSTTTTEELRQTPRRTPARHGGAPRRRHLGRNVSDIVFCLSPLVRPSPNRIWNQKGGGGVTAAEMGGSGEVRVPAMDTSSVAAAAFSKNRSRKLADFGRCKRIPH